MSSPVPVLQYASLPRVDQVLRGKISRIRMLGMIFAFAPLIALTLVFALRMQGGADPVFRDVQDIVLILGQSLGIGCGVAAGLIGIRLLRFPPTVAPRPSATVILICGCLWSVLFVNQYFYASLLRFFRYYALQSTSIMFLGIAFLVGLFSFQWLESRDWVPRGWGGVLDGIKAFSAISMIAPTQAPTMFYLFWLVTLMAYLAGDTLRFATLNRGSLLPGLVGGIMSYNPFVAPIAIALIVGWIMLKRSAYAVFVALAGFWIPLIIEIELVRHRLIQLELRRDMMALIGIVAVIVATYYLLRREFAENPELSIPQAVNVAGDPGAIPAALPAEMQSPSDPLRNVSSRDSATDHR